MLLRLIAAERAIRGVILIAAGTYLFGHLHSDLGKLADRWMRRLELDPNRHFLRRIVEHLHHVTTNEVKIFAFLAPSPTACWSSSRASGSGSTSSGRST